MTRAKESPKVSPKTLGAHKDVPNPNNPTNSPSQKVRPIDTARNRRNSGAANDESNEMLAWAREYVAKNWHVFPVHGINPDGSCTCGKVHDEEAGDKDKGKHPVLRNGVKGATKDLAQIEKWWGSPEGKYWNIGHRTGEISGTTALDIDTANGKKGGETWAALVGEKGEPETLMAITGSGGAHVFFGYNSAVNTSSNTLGPGVDCRNDGGYVVLPPARHKSGGRYKWDNWEEFADGKPLAFLPAHLTRRIGTVSKQVPAGVRYSEEQVAEMLTHIPADDRDLWREFGIVLGRHFNRSDKAWQNYVDWSNTWKGTKGRNHDQTMKECFYEISQQEANGASLSIGSLVAKAREHGWGAHIVKDHGILTFDELVTLTPPPRWAMHKLMPERGIGIVWGAKSAGKTFLIIDMVMHLALGKEWFGHRVPRPCSVLYLVLEGRAFFVNRIKAWQADAQLPVPSNVKFRIHGLKLTDPMDVEHLIGLIREAGGADVVLIDTLSAATVGIVENDSQGMGQAIEGMKVIEEATGRFVLAVHHPGKDESRGPRGNSNLGAAVDLSIQVSSDKNNHLRDWYTDKVKDAEDGKTYPFRLLEVPLGLDADGDAASSCVIRAAFDGPADQPHTARLKEGTHIKVAYDVLLPHLTDSLNPTERPRLSFEEAIDLVAPQIPVMEKDRARRRDRAKKAIEGLMKKKFVKSLDGDIWLA